MQQRVSLITLPVDDIDRAAAFYDALGWRREEAAPGMVVYDLIGQSLGLYPRADLARDMGVEAAEIAGLSGITLAHNVAQRDEVAALTEAARAAGARVLREAGEVFWGGVIAYVADPEGNVWEFAWNPHSPLSPEGAFRWKGYGG